jgi:hypothetical protein
LHAQARAQHGGRPARVKAKDTHHPGRWRPQALENLDERGLARAIGAEQADDLARRRDRQIDPAQGVHGLPAGAWAKAGAVTFVKVANLYGDHGAAIVSRAADPC